MEPPKRPRRGRTWPQRLVVTTGALVVVACTGAAVAAAYLGLRFASIDRVEDLTIPGAPPGEPANFLVVGTDSREGIDPDQPGNEGFLDDGQTGCDCTDTIMVVRVDPEATSAQVLSFPRDLRVTIAGTDKVARINTAHANGEQVLIDTIEESFDIPIHHYVEIDFVGFEQLVDAVGGVPMWFDAPVRDEETGLDVEEAGCRTLDGVEARRFVRSRYLQYQDEDGRWRSDPTADLGRITRQQIFIRRAISKAVGTGLTNPVRLNNLVSAGVDNVRLDERIDASDLLDLGRRFARFDADELASYTIPTAPYRTGGGQYGGEVLLEREAEPILNIFRGLPPGTVSPSSVDVTVLNGTGVEGQAADAAGALSVIGFGIKAIDSYPDGPVGRTTVVYGDGGLDGARRLARHITGGAALVYDPVVEAGEAMLITGSDFTTIHDQPAPEGSPDDLAITTTTDPSTAGTAESTGSTTEDSGGGSGAGATDDPGTTTTTVPEQVGYGTGEPPPGIDCG